MKEKKCLSFNKNNLKTRKADNPESEQTFPRI